MRVVAASNVPVADLVEMSTFLPDLYARLETFRVQLPALRDRRADIPLLVARYLAEHASEVSPDSAPPTIEASLMRALQHAQWPNNLRQLSSTIQRLIIEADGADEITAEHCRGCLTWLADLCGEPHESTDVRVERAMAATGNNKSAAARTLGVHRTTVHRALKRKRGA